MKIHIIMHESFEAPGAILDWVLKNNCEIIGVSRDSIQSHTNFECKYELPFPLIADIDSKICDQFEVTNDESLREKAENVFAGLKRCVTVHEQRQHAV